MWRTAATPTAPASPPSSTRPTKDHNHHSERTVASRKAERAANSEVAALRARVDALKETLRRGVDATAAVLADPDRFRGVLGSFAAQLTVADGYQKAIAAALGAAAEALTVNGLDAAVEVLTDIRTANAGTVGLVIASSASQRPGPTAYGRATQALRPRPARRPLAPPLAPGRRALGGRPGDRAGRAGGRGRRAARQRRGGSGPDRVGRVRSGQPRFSLRDRRRRPDRRALGARRVGRGAVAARRARCRR